MLFPGDEALKKISVLSGGEKSRVMLGKLLVTPANLLLLDEPTNHLDMESSDALLAAIDSFDGTVIMVTHNEMFLHSLAERLIVFQGDSIRTFEGSYQDFLDKWGWQDEVRPSPKDRSKTNHAGNKAKQTKKEIRRQRSDIIAQRSKAVKPLQNTISRLENDIENREQELNSLNESMQQASQNQEGPKIEELSRAIHTCQITIDRLFDELEEVSNELDSRSAVFEEQLQKLASDLEDGSS
jgi:ATP-binding cassette subfamily F protein 3